VVAASGPVNGPPVPLSLEAADLDHPHLLAWREACPGASLSSFVVR
jgi:hypothetical protein